MQAAAHGNLKKSMGPSKEVAAKFIHETDPSKRKKFAKALKGK